MTDTPHNDTPHNETPHNETPPLDPWLLDLAREVVADTHAASPVPRDMMWARITRERRLHESADAAATVPSSPRPVSSTSHRVVRRVTAIAAVLLGGVAIGRYLVPAPSVRSTPTVARADSVLDLGPEGLAALALRSDPAHVAMSEHLARTVSLLTTVRDQDPALGPGPDVAGWARDLLGTTRLLLDDPALRDERTRRLLQDLELVLVQIMQARSAAPATQRAPGETMRETNLLPRVRAVMTASLTRDDMTNGDN